MADIQANMSLFVYYIDAHIPLLSRRPQYPATLCKLEYLNEGGANVVYRLVIVNEGQGPARLQGRLLRLRKHVRHSRPTSEQMQAYNENFRHLFPDKHLIEHEMVKLDDGIASALNELLRKRTRPIHRVQDFLYQDDPHGTLITDMSPSEGEALLQVKPKWLLQSPSAPREATRCRTCALRAQRIARNAATTTDAQEVCPLMLISTSAKDRLEGAQKLCQDISIIEYLATDAQSTLTALSAYQRQFDARGALKVNGVDEMLNLCRAMTLRDCTLYVRKSTDGKIEARLGDLDLKQPEKLTAWRKTEHTLIDDGWYTNTEADEIFKREKICILSRWITT